MWKVYVRSTDNDGLFIERTFQVNVEDVNDPPTGVSISGSSSVPELSDNGTFVGELIPDDEDFNDTHDFHIVAVYSGAGVNPNRKVEDRVFEVNVSTGIVSVSDGAVLDYEETNEYTLQIVVADSGSPALSFTGTVVVNITDVNEIPSAINLSNYKVGRVDIEKNVIK